MFYSWSLKWVKISKKNVFKNSKTHLFFKLTSGYYKKCMLQDFEKKIWTILSFVFGNKEENVTTSLARLPLVVCI